MTIFVSKVTKRCSEKPITTHGTAGTFLILINLTISILVHPTSFCIGPQEAAFRARSEEPPTSSLPPYGLLLPTSQSDLSCSLLQPSSAEVGLCSSTFLPGVSSSCGWFSSARGPRAQLWGLDGIPPC